MTPRYTTTVPKVRFSATVGEGQEGELALV